MTDHAFHNNGSRVAEADCAMTADRDYTGYYDKASFDNQLAEDQPRHAFQKWWDWNRDYQLSFRLSWDQHTTTVARTRRHFDGNAARTATTAAQTAPTAHPHPR